MPRSRAQAPVSQQATLAGRLGHASQGAAAEMSFLQSEKRSAMCWDRHQGHEPGRGRLQGWGEMEEERGGGERRERERKGRRSQGRDEDD